MLRAVVLLALSTVVGLTACGGEQRAVTTPVQPLTDVGHGLSIRVPEGWNVAAANLTPHLVDPREELSVGTFPLSYSKGACAQFPSGTLERLGPRDAFVTLQERGFDHDYAWPDFPPRPAHFGPALGDGSEVEQCVKDPSFTDHWFAFSDGGRHFDVLVVFGPQAPQTARDQAWQILDSLRVDPGVRPDWRASP